MLAEYPTTVNNEPPVLSALAGQSQSVQLTRLYMGVEFNQEVRILEVTPTHAIIQTHDPKMLLCLEGTIHLHGGSLPRPVIARLKEMNFDKGVLYLSDISYGTMDWRKRRHERVQPKSATQVSLRFRQKCYRTELDNISVDGIGLLADKEIGNEVHLQSGTNIHLDFQLEPYYLISDLKGTLIYANALGKYLVKLGIRTHPTIEQLPMLNRYIFNRKEEIMDELSQAYAKACEPQHVENLYF